MQQRAGRVDEPPAWANEACGAGEDLLLADDELVEVSGCGPPFGVGVAPPCPGAEARHVDEYPVEAGRMALHPFVALARQRSPLGIVDPGAAQPAHRTLEAACRDVTGDELAAIAHACGKRQGLAACPGAEIDDPHPR